ncbi:class I SAM-dependent methyltransferase [Trinickia mobilis]|uniref:class I SAM-dependent methyltransferase n=1 Tax=Trinickia mobilis TaxID=2816356 RepID=UPI001A8DB51D|nr:class I SAM-dependent methyltransferase [Trinickia mobilis]
MISEDQSQTSQVFGYKWGKRETYESEAMRVAMKDFYLRHYGDVEGAAWWSDYGTTPKILDVGCGAGYTALELLGSRLTSADYCGVDISDAYKVAEQRFAERGLKGTFVQGDMTNLDLPEEHFDVILAEGVLHHTDNTEHAFKRVARHLKSGGRLLAYIYRKKGPIREFTDDYIREQISGLSPNDAWDALVPLTKLGIQLGELNVEVDITEPIEVLGIPAGKINLQRLFYWHIFKAYYRPEWSFDEMQHVNFDWYAPKNAHRHTFDEIERWCSDANLEIERADHEELAGYSIIARKR